MGKQLQVPILLLWFSLDCVSGSAAVTPLDLPAQLDNAVTVAFDGYPDYTVANTLFQAQGVLFTRDDGMPIYLSDWTALNRVTTSPDNVLATIRNVFTDPTWATHLNVLPTTSVFAMGAYFGNDQAELDFTTIRMSAFDLNGLLLGSVQVAANNNTNVDQFIGLRSDVPIARVRFDNLSASGAQSSGYAVVIDDLRFVPVPEPSTLAVCGLGSLLMILASRRKRNADNA